ncbi:COP9 signalosome complex subunit 7 isoform X6 [Rosa chinensis]|uniref:COP9 signalosome complex subunit 7 isoform X6 n=1 Tax=Rosa chinensis TaxID=74649 RepID=UPI000D08C81A|nr:COP9 signalosome complex subunit 7 isoform X6 [Rosa chinensis]
MDIEQKQEELIDHFVKQASSLTGSALSSVVSDATSHPSLFAFSEILALPNLLQLEGTENAVYLDVLRLFAHGTWSDYKSNAGRLPQLVPDQALKLRQLTVLTLAETNKGIVRGKLDQLRKCFEVQFAAGRDPRPEQLGSMIQTLSNWLVTSDNLLISIQEKMSWADKMTELNKQHKKEIEDKVEDVKRAYSMKADSDFRGHEEIYSEPGGVMDYEEDRSRPKRRRHPIYR